MPFSVGPMELVIVLVIALVILGPKRLPEAGKAVGRGIREFKDSISGTGSDEHETEREAEFEALPAPAQAESPTPAREASRVA